MTREERSRRDLDASGVRAGQTYRHFRTRAHYTVLATAVDTVTQLPVIVYVGPDGRAWTRPLEEWGQWVRQGDTPPEPRFALVRAIDGSGPRGT